MTSASRIELDAVPVRYKRGNILWGSDGSTAAIYRLPTISYALLPDNEKWAWLGTLAGLALSVEADMSIWVVNRRYPVEEYVAQAEGLLDPVHGDARAWRRMLEGHEAAISGLTSYLPEVYLRVALPRPSAASGTDDLRRQFYAAYRRVSEAYGVAPDAPVMEREITAVQALERLTMERVLRYMPDARRITPAEFQWLCLRCASRHVAEPVLDPHWQPNAMAVHHEGAGLGFEPRASDFTRLFDAATRRELRGMTVGTEAGATYQAFLTLGALPYNIEFPGQQAELLFRPMDTVDFPVDAVAHFQHITNKVALAQVDKAIIDAKNAIDEATSAGNEPDDRKLLAPELARRLKQILTSEGRPPMLDAQVSYAIGAATPEERARRIDAFRDQFPGLRVILPSGLQEALYHTHLPSPRGALFSDYHEMMIVDRLGMMMPIASREVGSVHGPYFAHTVVGGRARNPVKCDLTAPARDSLPTTINCSGRQGSGKTTAALDLSYQAAMRGSRVITVDPGNDHFLVEVPALVDKASLMLLGAHERCRGMLDPLVVSDPEMRHEVAMSYYLEVLHGDRSSESLWEHELSTAVATVIERGHGGSLAVIDILLAREGNTVAQDLGRRLKTFAANGLGILAFGDGTNVHGVNALKQITTIRMAGLALPSTTTPRESYNRAERIAVATYELVATLVLWLVTQDRGVHKIVVLDEAAAIPERTLDLLSRRGRKFNTTVIFCSQTVLDVSPKLRELIRMWLGFGTNSPEESARLLALMQLDSDNKVLCDRLADPKQFARGHGLFRDMDGRVAEIQVDIVEDDVLDALDTRPETRARKDAARREAVAA